MQSIQLHNRIWEPAYPEALHVLEHGVLWGEAIPQLQTFLILINSTGVFMEDSLRSHPYVGGICLEIGLRGSIMIYKCTPVEVLWRHRNI